MQSPEAIREQIERAKQVFFKHTRYGDKPWFMFTDENLGVNKKKLWDILEVIKDCNIRFSSFISLNFLEDPKTVRLLVEAGCAMALVGFESINEETLKFYNKSRQNSVEKFTRIIRQCREAGLCVQGNFLTNPAIDSFEDMDAVEEFVRKNHIVMPIYSLITPYPGTAMYLEYKEKGLVVDEDWDKYTAANLVVKSDKFDPFEYQVKYLEHYLAMYSWKTIFTRVLNNSNKLINFVTSAYFRKNLQDQLKNVKAGRRRPVGQEAVVAEAEAQPQVATEAVKG
jgi:bacteriochlorophyll C8 methyltransferase